MIRLLKSAYHWLRLMWIIATGWIVLMWMAARFLELSAVGAAARKAVKEIVDAEYLQRAAKNEPYVSYCPRCGQRPVGDRRMEEARERAIEILGSTPKMSELNFALEYNYFLLKRN